MTAHYGTVHGEAVGIMLPHVIRYNAESVGRLYGRLAEDIDLCDSTDPDAASRLAEFVNGLLVKADAPRSLSAIGVDPDGIPKLAEEAAKQWTGTFNPRPVDVTSLQELYQWALTDDNS